MLAHGGARTRTLPGVGVAEPEEFVVDGNMAPRDSQARLPKSVTMLLSTAKETLRV